MTEQENIGSVAMGDSEIQTVASRIVQAACELDHFPDPDDDDTLIITVQDLDAVIVNHMTAALSRPVQEPIGYLTGSNLRALEDGLQGVMTVSHEQNAHFQNPIYAAPQPAHGTSATERVASVNLVGDLNASALRTAVENFEDETGGFGDDSEFVVRGVIKTYLAALKSGGSADA